MKCKQCDGVGKVTIGGSLMVCGPCRGSGETVQAADYVEKLERKLYVIKHLASVQAEDPELWLCATSGPQAYLQQALRRLHVEIELRL